MHPRQDRHALGEGSGRSCFEYLENSFREHLGFSPPVFLVSSHTARDARESGDDEALKRSGLPAVENYIVDNLSENQRLLLKLRRRASTALPLPRNHSATL